MFPVVGLTNERILVRSFFAEIGLLFSTKNAPFYILNSSARQQPNSTNFVMQHPEE